MRLGVWLAALWVLAGCVQAGAGSGKSKPVDVRARAIEVVPDRLDGLTLLGAIELSADHPSFGGFSGLWMDDGRLIAISDVGWFLFAGTEERSGGLAPVQARMVQMRGDGGETFNKKGGDSEGLALLGEELVVSFERDHRIMTHGEAGQLGGTVRHRDWEKMSSNKGLEALAVLADGDLLALSEGRQDDAHRIYRISPNGTIEKRLLPGEGVFSITGADVGSDNKLYLVLRHFTLLTGISARVLRYDLDAQGWPVPASRKVMARFSSASGIDNMEGIAVWTDSTGRARLTLISDDNFRSAQRTLLIDLAIEP